MNQFHTVALAILALAVPAGAMGCPPEGWTLSWSDEFDGQSLDTTKWTALDIAWPYNNEQQYYTPQAVGVSGGMLTIRSERRNMGGRAYTSGRLETGGKFSQAFGRFEVRAKLPSTQGLWPAHWLLPASNAWPPEIDIMELLGHQPSTVYFSNHWGTAASPQHHTSSFAGPNFADDFHEFAVEWFPDRLDFFVDGVKHATHTSNVPQSPFFIILNTAVGGFWPGYPDPTTVLPQLHQVDYVRVYRRLLNEGMELAPPAFPTAFAWSRFGNAFVEPIHARSGTRSGKLFGQFSGAENFSGFYQDLPASPGESWAARVWWKNVSSDRMQGANQALTNIEWRDASGALIAFQSVPSLDAGSPLDEHLLSTVSGVAPPGTTTVRLALLFRQPALHAGAAFFDDATLFRTNNTCCPADVDDGTGSGAPDGGVTIDDLVHFLTQYDAGNANTADIDDGTGTGTRDAGVTIDDLLYFLGRFDAGC